MIWTDERKEMWRKLEDFDFDGRPVKVSFTEKLARENDWSLSFAQCALEEYRRFLFLSVAADHVICPSEAVDRVWHLHLTYTDSYWNRLCGDILQKKLGHDPSPGFEDDRQKHVDLYNQTLASYKACFNEAPPSYFWPEADLRFGEPPRTRKVDLSRSWVLPKRGTLTASASLAFFFLMLMTMGAEGSKTPCIVVSVIGVIIFISAMFDKGGHRGSGGGCGGGSGCGG